MIHDSRRYISRQNIVQVPSPPGEENKVYFGYICEPNVKGAVKTEYKRDGVILWAKPIPCEGHSKTNLMYGPKGKAYLKLDGRCYVSQGVAVK